ncbi:MAG: glycosyltransferase [Deltaproteobacteria bacterium]|nr:glycosyltransferase [Deltaproteobacteria bacterium]
MLKLEHGTMYDIPDTIIIHTLSSWHGKNNFRRMKYLYMPMQVYRLLKYLKKHRIKIIVSFLQRANIINIMLKIVYPHYTITNVRTVLSKAYNRNGVLPRIKYLLHRSLNFSNTIICNSNGIKSDLIKNFNISADKIKVIYNLYDIKTIKTLSQEPLDPEYNEIFKVSVVINVGNLFTPKAQWHLIRSFVKIKETIKDAKLVIIGQGNLEGYLKQLSKDTGFEKDIHFLGFQKNPFKFVSKAKIFVLSSLWEGFPNVLVEAMICGTPVISTDCRSGPREILAPNTDPFFETRNMEYAQYGLLVPVMDTRRYNVNESITREESIFADAMVTMLSNDQLRADYASRLSSRVMDFEQDKIVKAYLDTVILH